MHVNSERGGVNCKNGFLKKFKKTVAVKQIDPSVYTHLILKIP